MFTTKQVRHLMSQPVRTLGRNEKLSLAHAVMRADRIRHLPVVDDDGRLVGIVSQRDLFLNALVRGLGFGSAAQDRVLEAILVKEAMTEDVVTTTPDAAVTTAAQVMVTVESGVFRWSRRVPSSAS